MAAGCRCGCCSPAATPATTHNCHCSTASLNRLKQFRDLATRYAKRAAYYQAELTIAAIILWLR